MASSIVQPSRLSAISSRAIRSQRGERGSPSQARDGGQQPPGADGGAVVGPPLGKGEDEVAALGEDPSDRPVLILGDRGALADAQVGLGHRRQVEEVGLRRQAAGKLGAVRYQVAGIGLGEAAVPGQPGGR